MTLKEHIDDIRDNLEKRVYVGEAAVSQGIVLRLLDALTWPRYNTQVIIPEYSVEGRRVDFALCHPPSKPIVFIEVKQVGNIDGAERQLFEYAFHEGVPIAILTDGREWHFFHPSGQGGYRERKVRELDMIQDESEESAKCLNKYLNYESIRTNEAVEAIKEDYEEVVQQRQVATRLPEAWNKLIEEADEFLLHAVAEKTENLCDYRPTDEQVLAFLKSLGRKTEDRVAKDLSQSDPSSRPSFTGSRTSQTPVRPQKRRAPNKRLRVTMPNGTTIERPKATDTWVAVILELGPDLVMGVDYEELLVSTTKEFRQGIKHDQYYISTDYSTKVKKERLDRIAQRLGVQLKVEIVDK